jgi:hypothetical protein
MGGAASEKARVTLARSKDEVVNNHRSHSEEQHTRLAAIGSHC